MVSFANHALLGCLKFIDPKKDLFIAHSHFHQILSISVSVLLNKLSRKDLGPFCSSFFNGIEHQTCLVFTLVNTEITIIQ